MMVPEERWDAERLLKVAGSYWEACTLHTGVRLEIFSHLADGHLPAGAVAKRTGTNLRAMTMLLNALAAMGLLVKNNDLYANTPDAARLLDKTSKHYCGYLISHHGHLIKSWADLLRAVQGGEPLKREPYNEEEERESFLMGMFNLAMASAPAIAREVDLRGRHQLLDLGGGPGTYAIFFCLAHPQLRATVYDLPSTQPFALRTIEQFGLKERIDFMAGDYAQEDIPGSYDVAWLSHILHAEGPDDCHRLINKTVSVLEPGGLILVQDFMLDKTLDRPLFPALFSLNMLINTAEGQSYSEGQIVQMLRTAGVKDIRRLPFRGPNDAGIVAGTV